MARRDQPYLPLYVQDFLTDEKLNECSASATGVYIKLLCFMHKSEHYGKIELKAKYKQKQKQNESTVFLFAVMLAKYISFSLDEIQLGIQELIDEKVCYVEDDFLCQKRMIKDGDISLIRSMSGSKGGKLSRNSSTKKLYNEPGYVYLIHDIDDKMAFKIGISKEPDKRLKGIIKKHNRPNLLIRKKWNVEDMGFCEQMILDYYEDIRNGEWIYGEYDIFDIEVNINNILLNQKQIKSKSKANSENENEIHSIDNKGISNIQGGLGDFSENVEIRKNPHAPTLEKVIEVFHRNGNKNGLAEKFFNWYESKNWMAGPNMITRWESLVPNWIIEENKKEATGKNKNIEKPPLPVADANAIIDKYKPKNKK